MSDSRTVADHVIARIARDGVDAVFSVTGGGVMYLVDAIARSNEVRLISTQHEEYAGVAADGYARAGKPYGVAMGTTGPGAAQLFTAVAAAYQDSSPVLFLAGQVKTSDSTAIQSFKVRQNGTFEFDTRATFSPICKYHSVVRSADDIEKELEAALEAASSGRPGPVMLELPLDVQGSAMPDRSADQQGAVTGAATPVVGRCAVGSDDIADLLARALAEAKRPLVLIGIGAVRSADHPRLTSCLDEVGIPYVVTQFARQVGVASHSLFLGSPGIKANRSANLAVCNADLLVVIGSSLHQQVIGWDADEFVQLPAHKVWFEIDADVRALRNALVDEAYELDAATAALALESASSKGDHRGQWADWRRWCIRVRDQFFYHYPSHPHVDGRMCLYRAVSVLDARRDQFSAVTSDAGIAWYVLAQHYVCAPGSAYVSSGSFGAMGMALPFAVGASVATQAPVLAMTGDGSLMMSIAELATVRANHLPIVIVVNNNEGYLSIRSTQNRYFDGRTIGTDSINGVFIPDFEALASVFDIHYCSARSETELATVIDEITKSNLQGPVMVEVFTYTDQAVEPLVESRRRSDGTFTGGSLANMSPDVEMSAWGVTG